ncbi:MAG: hypothetical protein JKY13_02575, partial [Gammaproteobacteria bacterium]|nr:hypothetical protein [Gammaproteobacteria bacterium]
PLKDRKLLEKQKRLHGHTARYDDFNFPGYQRDLIFDDINNDNPLSWRRYFKLALAEGDFMHSLQSVVETKVANAGDNDFVDTHYVAGLVGNEAQDAIEPRIRDLQVNAAHTPKLGSFSVDYTASVSLDLTARESEQQPDQLLHLHPFGYAPVFSALNEAGNYPLMPQYLADGYLFIGLRNATTPEKLSLLLQMVEASGKADISPPKVRWSYLSDNRWLDFNAKQFLADSSHGLLDPGIVKLALPQAASNDNALLANNLHWLRVSVDDHGQAIGRMLSVHAQAARATLQLTADQQPQHLAKGLAANSINSSIGSVSVTQPYSSFSGKPRESSAHYLTRVSERLRHKQRALSAWDYERLLLEEFPEIYLAKCIPQTLQRDGSSEARLRIIVIINIAQRAPFFPLQPKAPVALLSKIKRYLQNKASSFVNIEVRNPPYEQIRYRLAVRFHESIDAGDAINNVNDEVVRFLSPWAYGEQTSLAFGNKVYSTELLHHLDQLPYVDYIAQLKLVEQVALGDNELGLENAYALTSNTNTAAVRKPTAILVSAPQHIIDVIEGDDYKEQDFIGIGYGVTGLDLDID